MKQKKLFLTLLVAVGAIAALLTMQATLGTASSVYTPSELLSAAEGNTVQIFKRIRVAGRVTSEPIDYRVDPAIELRFTISDREGPEVSVPVVYRNLKPDMFAPGRDVLIDGDFEGGVLVAASLLTQCPSKYEPPSPSEDTY